MTRYRILANTIPQRRAREPELAHLFGRNGTKWSVNGVPGRVVDAEKIVSSNGKTIGRELSAVYVWVLPFVKRNDGRKSSAHRVRCRCPGCNREMSAGRLFQHVCKGEANG